MTLKPKLLRITTVPISLHKLLQGQPKYFQQKGFEVILASAKGKEIAQIEQKTGLKVNILPLTRKISPLTDLKALWQTYKLIKKHQPDIVHTHTPKAGIIGMLAAKLAGVPVRMHTVAGMPLLESSGLKRKILNFVEWFTYRSATHVYPNSYGLHEIIKQLNFAPEEKLKVLGNGSSNGIDTDYFNSDFFSEIEKNNLRTQLGIQPDDIVYIFVGRLVKDKGVKELVEAFVRLQKEYKNIKLLLVGNEEPELDPLPETTHREIQNNAHIITTGWVEDVRPYLAIANIFTFPSYREGFPNVVMQASAMNLPSIVSDINGCNEIIKNSFNGLIIPEKNTDALYNAMNELLENEVLRQNMAQNARPNILKKYQQQVVWAALLEEYKRLLKN